ncbi:hypothetical protein A2U01_0084827, partial [Trifolium medium]|nr:hypothetical protein [Trifolium medium]
MSVEEPIVIPSQTGEVGVTQPVL